MSILKDLIALAEAKGKKKVGDPMHVKASKILGTPEADGKIERVNSDGTYLVRLSDKEDDVCDVDHDGTVLMGPPLHGKLVRAESVNEDNNVKAYKLTVPSDITESELWDWVEAQEVVTIEDIKKTGTTLYVYPHFGDKYSDATLNKLKKSLSSFLNSLVTEGKKDDVEWGIYHKKTDKLLDGTFSGKNGKKDAEEELENTWDDSYAYVRRWKEGDKVHVHESSVSGGRTKTHYEGGEFDADIDSLNHHLKQIRLIVQSPAMAHHIRDTLKNFDVDTKAEHRAVENAVHALQQAIGVFYHKMQEAE